MTEWFPKRTGLGPIVIAEIGVNHNGDPALARDMIDAAQKSGADVVKFQTFVTEKVVSPSLDMAEYQKANLGSNISQYDMIKPLEISWRDMERIIDYCHLKGIEFLTSVADEGSLDFLVSCDAKVVKIASGDVTNTFLLRKAAISGLAVILSTGMASLGEIEKAVSILERGGCEHITLLHCTSNYPAPYNEINLKAMLTLQTAFGYPVGYSDHTQGYEVALGAVALGAVAIEKHFTLDRTLPGPDHKASTEPAEFEQMVRAIRNLSLALGGARKSATPSELAIRRKVRKSLVAAIDIAKGTVVERHMLSAMRVGEGLSPDIEEVLIGARAKCTILTGQALQLGMLEFPEPELQTR